MAVWHRWSAVWGKRSDRSDEGRDTCLTMIDRGSVTRSNLYPAGDGATRDEGYDGISNPGQRRLTVAEVDAILLALPKFERDIYLAHRIGGMPYRDIAHRLDIGVERVEQAIAFALFEIMQAARAIHEKDGE